MEGGRGGVRDEEEREMVSSDVVFEKILAQKLQKNVIPCHTLHKAHIHIKNDDKFATIHKPL